MEWNRCFKIVFYNIETFTKRRFPHTDEYSKAIIQYPTFWWVHETFKTKE